MRLADAQPAVEVQPDTGQHVAPAEELSAEIRLTVLWPVNEVDQIDDGRLTDFYTYPSTTCSRAGCAAT